MPKREISRTIPEGYAELLAAAKDRVRRAHISAARRGNSELVLMYLALGQLILDRQADEGWGTRVLERLAEDLQSEFPAQRGFSRRNLLYFAGTNAAAPVTIHRRTAARDHTERLLRWTGVEVIESDNSLTVRPGRPSPFSLTVPGDPSGAAFLGALHVASPRAGATLTVPGVGINARRTGFFDVLRAMGVVVGVTSTADTGPETVG